MIINQDKCVQCGRCIEACTMDAIEWDKDNLDRDVVTITETCVDCYCPAMDECLTDAINFAQLDSDIRVYNECRGFEALRVKDKYDSRFWLDHLTLPQRMLSIKMTVKFKQWELDVIKRQDLSRIGYNKLQEQIRNVIAKKNKDNDETIF